MSQHKPLLTAQSQPIADQLRAILSHFHKVQYLFEWLDKTQKLFTATFGFDENDPSKQIISTRNRLLVERVLRAANVTIPIFGPNNSGKSALFNYLLGCRLLTSQEGHVTGRICIISGCDMEFACVATSSLKEYMEGKVSEASMISVAGKDTKELAQILKPLIERRDDHESATTSSADPAPSSSANGHVNTNSEEKRGEEDWCKTIVHVRYPFPFLQSGVTLIDLPGTSRSDRPEIQEQLSAFLRATRPPGILFVYENASFADAENLCYQFLTDSLPNGDVDQNPSIFFVHNKFHTATSGPNQTSLTTDDWKEAAQKCYEMISSQRLPLSSLTSPSFLDESCSWAPISVRELHMMSDKPVVVELKEHLLKALLLWLLRLQNTRYYAAHNIITEACSNFFLIVNAIRDNRMEDIERELQHGLQALTDFEKDITSRLHPLLHGIVDEITERVQNTSYLTVALSKARQTRLEVFDGRRRLGNEQQAMGALQIAIAPHIQSVFVQPAIAVMQEKISVQVEEGIQRLLDSVKDNSLLLSGIRNCIRTTSVDTTGFINAGYSGALLGSFVASVMSTGVWAGVLLPLSTPVLAALFIGAVAQTAWLTIAAAFGTIDAEWKSACAQFVISRLPQTIDTAELERLGTSAIERLVKDIADEMQLRSSAAAKARKQFKQAEPLMPKLRWQFAHLELRCWIAQLNFQQLYVAPTLDSSSAHPPIPSSPHLQSVFLPAAPGMWLGKPVHIKQCTTQESPEPQLPFLEYLHYSRCLSRANAPRLLLAWSVYQDPSTKAWCAITRACKGSLHQFLSQPGASASLSTLQKLNIVHQVALGLSSLHSQGICHRDLNSHTILYDYSSSEKNNGETITMEIFLTDFSIRPDSCPIQGPFCPPELEHGATYTPSSDVYSMGILASFMIPDMKAAMKAESAISAHWQLLLDCQSSQPNQRPKASAVVEAVAAIEGFLTRN